MTERLINEFNEYALDTLTDYLSILARDIEDALIQCGAEPGKDYGYLDLFKLAVACRNGEKK